MQMHDVIASLVDSVSTCTQLTCHITLKRRLIQHSARGYMASVYCDWCTVIGGKGQQFRAGSGTVWAVQAENCTYIWSQVRHSTSIHEET